LRSATQATDSTWSGCTAKSAATNALLHAAPVSRTRRRKRSTVLATWRRRFVAWKPGALFAKGCASFPSPWSSASSIRDIHVSGCQFAWSVAVRDHDSPPPSKPWRTWRFS